MRYRRRPGLAPLDQHETEGGSRLRLPLFFVLLPDYHRLMKKRQLQNLGYEGKELLGEAMRACGALRQTGVKGAELREIMKELIDAPEEFLDHSELSTVADMLSAHSRNAAAPDSYHFRHDLHYNCWGEENIETDAHLQMEQACQLPISAAGALMPDAHLGYGLPIGGVLATKNAVIPYAVGVDIACRVMLSVVPLPLVKFNKNIAKFERALEENTRFGMGAKWSSPKEHDVLDRDWKQTPFLAKLKDSAWKQLGTSGSGNHFVEFGELNVTDAIDGLDAGTYLALVSHSGSRGPGARIATHYSKLAREKHPKLPRAYKHLAWLDLDDEAGIEYWNAMELMGEYASANHHLIHRDVLKAIGEKPFFQVENHHNFAWKEKHLGEELIVHRKGATPAGKGVLGYIPGSMTAPGFLVEGAGEDAALHSCAHGAGRRMSRRKAKQSISWHELRKKLDAKKVTLISAGLDESPHAYKDIHSVMKAQQQLVRPLARFQPRLVKMAPEGEKPED